MPATRTKDGASSPLLKDIGEAALEGEMECHLDEKERSGGNLQQRGVADILIASIDNLKGSAEAITAIYLSRY